jgi:hypothetical protein
MQLIPLTTIKSQILQISGSPRDQQARFQDAMAIERKQGKPDLFITVTCNTKWPEIFSALLPGQTAQDRPDITARVFHLKLKAILEDITDKHIFGRVTANIQVHMSFSITISLQFTKYK